MALSACGALPAKTSEACVMSWICCFCSEPLGIEGISLDHDTPLSMGGPTILSNLLVC